MSNYSFIKNGLYSTRFIGCKLINIKLNDTSVVSTLFEECALNYCNFTFSNIDGLIINNSTLDHCAFNQTYVKRSDFQNDQFTDCELLNIKFDEIDFSTSIFHRIKINDYSLHGATINRSQAVELIKILGVKVK
jgi:uncharacterized protein YjbI with pentapeptide repeats